MISLSLKVLGAAVPERKRSQTRKPGPRADPDRLSPSPLVPAPLAPAPTLRGVSSDADRPRGSHRPPPTATPYPIPINCVLIYLTPHNAHNHEDSDPDNAFNHCHVVTHPPTIPHPHDNDATHDKPMSLLPLDGPLDASLVEEYIPYQ